MNSAAVTMPMRRYTITVRSRVDETIETVDCAVYFHGNDSMRRVSSDVTLCRACLPTTSKRGILLVFWLDQKFYILFFYFLLRFSGSKYLVPKDIRIIIAFYIAERKRNIPSVDLGDSIWAVGAERAKIYQYFFSI